MSVADLVQKFRNNSKDVSAPSYREHQLRVEYINPMFERLGWDVLNAQGRPVALKDVVHEDSVRVEGRAKAPDYGFRTEGARRFFVEAKSPYVGIDDAASALQLRRYGWSAKLSVSILTDFATIKVYDCRVPPADSDGANVALLYSISCDEYVDRWQDLEALLSRAAVLSGSLEKFAIETADSRGFIPVDQAFLAQISHWRSALAGEISRTNKGISLPSLNSAVQLIIDRIIFLRIAEDRGIEAHGNMLSLCEGKNVYKSLVQLFRQADARYNSGLFHFDNVNGQPGSPDTVTPSLKIGDVLMREIIQGVYRPKSQYEFSVMPAELLGQVYEQFLGKVIQLSNNGAIVEDKPEVKKSGGVFYTPVDVVRFIVARSIQSYFTSPPLHTSAKVGRKTIKAPLRVLDPACGSGSFLIEVYQQLLDWHLDWYVADGADNYARGRNPKLFEVSECNWRLTIAEKRRILLAHVYGVDIDTQAVEVTKLSLLLKMLEGESNDALAAQMDLFETRVLPDLSSNIKCGNSLVGADIFPDLFNLNDAGEEIVRNNPFEWDDEFPFENHRGKFDIIVGNPPYIDSEWMTKHWPHERSYCTRRYTYASGNWDIFCAFIGKAVDLLNAGGSLSFIVPNKLMTSTYAQATRRYLIEHGRVDLIRDYSSVPVFPVAVYPIVFGFKLGSKGVTQYEKVTRRDLLTVKVDQIAERELAKDGSEWQFEGELDEADRFQTLGECATICDAATVSEAYELRDLLSDRAEPRAKDLIVVNSGTIDPYEHHWGRRALRYIKRSMLNPVITASNQKAYSERRIAQAHASKIMVANMTKKIEAIYDEEGVILATKSVNVILPHSNPWVILAILNSEFMSRYYDSRFHGRKLSGGYLQVVPATLRSLPIPAAMSQETQKRIEALCRQMMQAKSSLHGQEGHAHTIATRGIVALEVAIEKEVAALYAPLKAGKLLSLETANEPMTPAG